MAEKKTVDITVLRRFRYNGKKIAVGEILTVDRHFASEMIAANKAKEGKDPNVKKEYEKSLAKAE